jgi:tetratricopeptide (TPR) repeat protein
MTRTEPDTAPGGTPDAAPERDRATEADAPSEDATATETERGSEPDGVPADAAPAASRRAAPGAARASTPGAGRLAALEDQRDFLLRSLDDLERERAAGDVDDADYETLKDDYTARAARTIRAIEAHRDRSARAGSRPRRSWRRLVATVAGVAAFAVLAGVLVAQASGRREADDPLTGEIRQTTRAQLGEALTLAGEQRYDEAIAVYDEVLDEQPGNVEALTYKGWVQFLSGDSAGIDTLTEATETDPDYPDAHAFWVIILCRAGRSDAALSELDRLEALDPPPFVLELVGGLRERAESGGCTAPAATDAPPASTPAG